MSIRPRHDGSTRRAGSPAAAGAAVLAVQSLLDEGQTVLAYEAATRALSTWKDDTRLLRSLGLALARLRALEPANALLLRLFRRGPKDAETAGILARTFKDLWEASAPGARRLKFLRSAFRYYAIGYGIANRHRDLDGAIYTGINAATIAWLLGRRVAARRRALDLQRVCRRRLKRGSDYWATAALGEAALLLGDLDAAASLYRSAASLAPGQLQRRASTRHNARLLLRSMRMPDGTFDACFDIPSVTLVGSEPGDRVEAPIHTRRGIAYVQVQSTEDLLGAERLLAARADLTVILPLPRPALEASGHPVWAAPRWKGRGRRLLQRAGRVVVAHERGTRLTPTTVQYTAALQRGLAALHAQRLETIVTVAHAMRRGRGSSRPASTRAGLPRGFQEEIKALLFADVHGYSNLNESQIPRFVSEFMGTAARTLSKSDIQPDIKYTWGDALYFVFPSAASAAGYALNLQEALARKNWRRLGLPDLSLRVSLHVGPALRCLDPVQETVNYTGSHVSWAARIEPVTPPGQVYASEPFAALVTTDRKSDVICEYVGATMLAKGFGTYPLYRVRRRT